MTCAPAFVSRRMTFAWRVRRNGNLPIRVMVFVSIATMTTSGAACSPRSEKRASTVSRSVPRKTSNAHRPSTSVVVVSASVV